MKPHRLNRPISAAWFMKTSGYRFFMLRELTSVPIAAYLVFLIIVFWSVGAGQTEYDAVVAMLTSPEGQIFHAVVFVSAVFHTVTWFNAAPKIQVVRVGEERVPDIFVAIGTGYAPWLVVSAFVYWFALM